MRRIASIAAGLALAASGLVACGSGQQDAYYQPSAWGAYGECYYLYSPYECYGHHYGRPTAMPLWWHQRYAAYYDSPAYRTAYVPTRYRATAAAGSRAFERTYKAQIAGASRSATWRSSTGGTVPGTKVGRSAVYGGGGARSTGFSSGGRVNRTGSPCASVRFDHALLASIGGGSLLARGGSSSSGGGHSFGGGGSRSSSFGSGSSRGPSGSTGSRSGSRSGRSC